jgi:hypothetical protein
VIWNRQHLQRVLTRYLEHYNSGRPHRGIGLDVPAPALAGTVTTLPEVNRVEPHAQRTINIPNTP